MDRYESKTAVIAFSVISAIILVITVGGGILIRSASASTFLRIVGIVPAGFYGVIAGSAAFGTTRRHGSHETRLIYVSQALHTITVSYYLFT